MNIIQALDDKNLLGASFPQDTRQAWRAVLSAAFCVPMDDDTAKVFKKLSGGRRAPKRRVTELDVIAGRRSDKTHVSAGIAVYLATVGCELDDTLDRLAPGERPVISIIACDRAQAKAAISYVKGILAASPVMAPMIHKQAAESVTLVNGVTVELGTNNHRSIRGRTLIACIFDESAFFRSEQTTNPDIELFRAVQPSLSTTKGMLVQISSPYAKTGLLYSRYKKYYGQNSDDVLVVQGGTLDFNPTIDPRIIEEAERDDPEAAKAEWHGQFRDDVSSFVSREMIEDVTRSEPQVIPYARSCRHTAFIDMSGGRADEHVLAIGHPEQESMIIDGVFSRRGDPEQAVKFFSEILHQYRLNRATADRYAGDWPVVAFKRHGVNIVASAKNRSSLYQDSLPIITSGKCQLPPDQKLLAQFCALERRTSRSGKDTIDHGPNGHDDRANAVAGVLASQSEQTNLSIWAKLAR